MTNKSETELKRHLADMPIDDRTAKLIALYLTNLGYRRDNPPQLEPISEQEVLKLFETFQLTTDTHREEDFPCIPQWNFKDLIHFICAKYGKKALKEGT